MYLFFDTETTGLIENINGIEIMPRMVQIAYILSDENCKIIEQNEFLIRPNNFEIPEKSIKIHGITNEKALMDGVDIDIVLKKITEVFKKSKYVVAHNLYFDESVLKGEFERLGLSSPFINKTKICTANDLKSGGSFPFFCKNTSMKYSLGNLHLKLFGVKFENSHNAFSDTLALFNCFWFLKAKGHINIKNT